MGMNKKCLRCRKEAEKKEKKKNGKSVVPETTIAEPSDGLVKSQDTKRGNLWTDDEHRSFLTGLEELGKGEWKRIANKYVPSRSPAQVASHAQKHFSRFNRKIKQRPSVFDISLNQGSKDEVECSLRASSSAIVLRNSVEIAPKEQEQALVPKNIIEIDPEEQEEAPVSTNVTENDPSNNVIEIDPEEQPAVMATTSERGPMNNRSISENLQPRVPSFAPVNPTVSWIPIVNFPNQNNVFLPIIYGMVVPQHHPQQSQPPNNNPNNN